MENILIIIKKIIQIIIQIQIIFHQDESCSVKLIIFLGKFLFLS
jgi:hypothetical protein